jgi:hypothetical protein
MRQWVLVASWNPLVVFMHRECYVRFAVEEYDDEEGEGEEEEEEKQVHFGSGTVELMGGGGADRLLNGEQERQPDDGIVGTGGGDNDGGGSDDDERPEQRRGREKAARLQARGGFKHLVNNSVSKYSSQFNRVFLAENGEPVRGHMWSNTQLSSYLRWHAAGGLAAPHQHCQHEATNAADADVDVNDDGTDTPPAAPGGREDVYAAVVKPAMQAIALGVLRAAMAQGQPRQRPNSFEVFGFDFFLDEAYKPWLIEVNSSPAVDYSTPITEAYCGTGLVDSVRVGLDWKAWWARLRTAHAQQLQKEEAQAAQEKHDAEKQKEQTQEKEEEEEEEEAEAPRPVENVGSQAQLESSMGAEAARGDHPSVGSPDSIAGWWAAEPPPDVGVWELLMSPEELLAAEVDIYSLERAPTQSRYHLRHHLCQICHLAHR